MKYFTVASNDDGMRLDKWCKKHVPLPYGTVRKLFRKKDIKLEGKVAKIDTLIRTGQTVTVYAAFDVPSQTISEYSPSKAQIDELRNMVIYEDNNVIALNKPPGLPVQGGSGVKDSIDARLDGLSTDSVRPRLVHRLDRHTSGILLLGKSRETASALTEAFRQRETQKIYWAVVMGTPAEQMGSIDIPLGKIPHENYEKMAAITDPSGKEALTYYRVIASCDEISWLELRPVTGRTHQLRAHLQAIGHPIIGDGKYGGKSAFPTNHSVKTLHLHSRLLRIKQPYDVDVTAPLPGHIQQTLSHYSFPMDDQGVSLLELE